MLCFFSGSSVEIPEPPIDSTQCVPDVDLSHWDIDIMHSVSSFCALDQHHEVPDGYVGEVKRICTEGIPFGYARLFDDRDWEEKYFHANLRSFLSKDIVSRLHGPAVEAYFKEFLFGKNSQITIWDLKYYLKYSFVDSVFSVHSPYWPNQAREWAERKRSFGFPDRSLVKEVLSYGCDLVRTPPKINFNGTNIWGDDLHNIKEKYWRFSFSMAEYKIIQSWTTSQKIVYRTLHTLYKRMISNQKHGSSKLCTYYFKTLMLWECERRDKEIWSTMSLQSLVCELLLLMISCLKKKRIKNYFIRKNNMIAHLRDADIITDVDGLHDILKQTDLINEVVKCAKYNEEFLSHVRHQLELPSWLYRFAVLVANFSNSAKYTSNNDLWKAALKEELYDVCCGLYCQREAADCDPQKFKQILLQSAKKHFCRATQLYQSSNTCFVDLSNDSLLKNKLAWLLPFIKLRSSSEYNIANVSDIDKQHPEYIVRKRNFIQKSNKTNLYNRNLRSKTDIPIPESNMSDIQFYFTFHKKEVNCIVYSKGVLPMLMHSTICASWFISKAYEANLLYTTERDFTAVRQSYEDVMQAYQSPMIVSWCADFLLPVFISTQWTAVYDSDIQSYLGFYCLCSFVLHKNEESSRSRDVDLLICPVQFLVYLRLRCTMEESITCNTRKEIEELKSFWSDHNEQYDGDKYANNARIVLMSILRSRGFF